MDDDDPFTLQTGVINRDRIDAFGVVLNVGYDLGFAELTSVAGFNNSDRQSRISTSSWA